MRKMKNREKSDRRSEVRQLENEKGFVREGERMAAEMDRRREDRGFFFFFLKDSRRKRMIVMMVRMRRAMARSALQHSVA